jgi:hypothetical protein
MSAAIWNVWLPLGLVAAMGLLIIVLPALVIADVNRREHRALVVFAREQSEKSRTRDKAA